ncbi:MAG: hypothetical protein KatS3mg014_0427 [Actinomycetota bacterium]|nr:MAG: hypothetical protein KatS3mg014_0427 [Actinomycetota bacterium]
MSPFLLSVFKYALLALLYLFIYRAVRAVAAGIAPRPTAAADDRGPAARRPGRGRTPTALVVHVPEDPRPRTVRLTGTLEIGRAESCQVRLEDAYASLHHARLQQRDGVWTIEDLGSTNGTYVNDRRISAPVEVRAGDVVRIGKTVLELRR